MPSSGALSATRTVPAVPSASAAPTARPTRSRRKSAEQHGGDGVDAGQQRAAGRGGAGEAEVTEEEAHAGQHRALGQRAARARAAQPSGGGRDGEQHGGGARELDGQQVGGPQPVQRDDGERGAHAEHHGRRGDGGLPAPRHLPVHHLLLAVTNVHRLSVTNSRSAC